jgi:NAD-dependent dihydropyrimidine dehydrogenase PreA subunit
MTAVNKQEHSIVIEEDKCTGCGICVDYCHVDAIAVNPDTGVVEILDLDTCIECHSCQQNCPQGAIKVYPQLDDSLQKIR